MDGGSDEEDERALAALQDAWDRLCPPLSAKERSEFDRLVKAWAPHRAMDPAIIETDLLSPIGREFRETSHTQALGYLLDPKGSHGLKEEPLATFLEIVTGDLDDAPRAAFVEAAQGFRDAAVHLERASVVGCGADDVDGRISRTDIWIEIPAEDPLALVVVEAKLETTASAGQLGRYDDLITDRLRSLGRQVPVIRVYLTPWGDSPHELAGGKEWHSLGLFTVALGLRQVLTGAHGAGAEFLRLYLATLLQKVLKVRWTDPLSRAQEQLFLVYLRVCMLRHDREA